MDKHPIPWGDNGTGYVVDANGTDVEFDHAPTLIEIVRAVNSHAALLEALKDCLVFIEDACQELHYPTLPLAANKAREALRKAGV